MDARIKWTIWNYRRIAFVAVGLLLLVAVGTGESLAAFPACETPAPTPSEIGVPVDVPLSCPS